MKKIRVHLKDRSYDILIGRGLIEKCGGLLRSIGIGRDAFVITNKGILSRYGRPLEKSLKKSGFSVRFGLVPDSEKAKTTEVAVRLINRLSAYDKNKELFIIAFGGGVIGDLSGFVAAVYKRGVPYGHIPTTLLAQVDSAIGGKVAVDLAVAKNLVGAFYQPKMVISDTSLIKTLPSRQVKNGLAEVIKYGVIKDRRLFEFLESNCSRILKSDAEALEYVVTRSSQIKAEIVEKDEFDRKGVRAVLNYGHTIGHAVEAACGYSKRYNHGEAVAIGMAAAADIALELGMLARDEAVRIKQLIKKSGLPTGLKGLSFSKIYKAHLHDKKFIHRKNRFVLPAKIGRVKVVEGVPDEVVRMALRKTFLDR